MEKVYTAEKDVVNLLHKTRQKVHGACSQCMHRPVRIETVDGDVFEGMIVNVDKHYIYLLPGLSGSAHIHMTRSPYPYSPGPYYPPYNPYAQQILPLVLFNLLAITLI
jgi:hypothetical protein